VEKIKQNAFVKKVGFNRIILVLVMLVMYLSFGLPEESSLECPVSWTQ
jgi:ribose transport system permease protein